MMHEMCSLNCEKHKSCFGFCSMMHKMCSLQCDRHIQILSHSMVHEICLLMRENTSQEIPAM